MKVLVVAGARPNFMKVGPILRALRAGRERAVLVHTGQHYDRDMSDAFFRDLRIPAPDHHLEVGSATHAVQTARIMEAFEPVLEAERPDWVVVVGDVNSTLACALVAAKRRPDLGCRVAHVEAGLRSHDWRMPEEVNRVLADRLSDLLLTPSHDALSNLLAEGIPGDRVVFVGNVMIDTLHDLRADARAMDMPGRLGVERGRYAVVTLHRPSNVDEPHVLETILRALGRVAGEMPVLVPLHPRTRARIDAFGLGAHVEPLRPLGPLGYVEMLSLQDGAAVVITDSGGLQEETTALGVPCVTLREQTERPVTLTEGTNRLAPWPLTEEGVFAAYRRALRERRSDFTPPDGWDGRAAGRIVQALRCGTVAPAPEPRIHPLAAAR
jgi:UDP-N-acetylglucosamine 2-epimerase (non-hydrolysing)